jgi:hypothetical protein
MLDVATIDITKSSNNVHYRFLYYMFSFGHFLAPTSYTACRVLHTCNEDIHFGAIGRLNFERIPDDDPNNIPNRVPHWVGMPVLGLRRGYIERKLSGEAKY